MICTGVSEVSGALMSWKATESVLMGLPIATYFCKVLILVTYVTCLFVPWTLIMFSYMHGWSVSWTSLWPGWWGWHTATTISDPSSTIPERCCSLILCCSTERLLWTMLDCSPAIALVFTDAFYNQVTNVFSMQLPFKWIKKVAKYFTRLLYTAPKSSMLHCFI